MSPDYIIGQIITGAIAGITAALLLKIFGWFFKPRLRIYFKENDSYTEAPVQSGETFLFTHLVVENIRKSIAVGCRVFILKIEKKNNKKFESIPLKVYYTLKWSNENEPKGYEGLVIPGNYRRRIDLASARLDSSSGFSLFIEGGARGVVNKFYEGEYRFTVQATGDNTNTVTKRFILELYGNFKKDNIRIKEENLFKKLWFKIIK